MAPGVESSEVLSQKVWVLRVSVHCEGCKKKIRRILSKVHGVTDVAIDAQRKMVRVTGAVDGDTLVKRLAKSNKYAEILAQESIPAPAKANADAAPEQPKNETKDTSKPKELKEAAAPEDKPAAAAPATAAPEAAKSVDASSGPAAAAAAPTPAKEPAQTNAETEKKDEKKLETDDVKKPAAEGTAAAAAASPDKAGGDGGAPDEGGKKEAKKEEKATKKDDGSAAAATKSRDVADMYPFPVLQPQPPYVISYNMAQPTASHAYYAPPMATATQGYVYYPGYGPPPPESYYPMAAADSSWSSSQQPAHTYDSLFSEENPNGCVVM